MGTSLDSALTYADLADGCQLVKVIHLSCCFVLLMLASSVGLATNVRAICGMMFAPSDVVKLACVFLERSQAHSSTSKAYTLTDVSAVQDAATQLLVPIPSPMSVCGKFNSFSHNTFMVPHPAMCEAIVGWQSVRPSVRQASRPVSSHAVLRRAVPCRAVPPFRPYFHPSLRPVPSNPVPVARARVRTHARRRMRVRACGRVRAVAQATRSCCLRGSCVWVAERGSIYRIVLDRGDAFRMWFGQGLACISLISNTVRSG